MKVKVKKLLFSILLLILIIIAVAVVTNTFGQHEGGTMVKLTLKG